MNGTQFEQSSFTVGGDTSEAYRENWEKIFKGKKEVVVSEARADSGTREARAVNDAGALRAAVLALLKTVENGWKSKHGRDSELWRELESVVLAEKALASDEVHASLVSGLARRWASLLLDQLSGAPLTASASRSRDPGAK